MSARDPGTARRAARAACAGNCGRCGDRCRTSRSTPTPGHDLDSGRGGEPAPPGVESVLGCSGRRAGGDRGRGLAVVRNYTCRWPIEEVHW